MAQKRPRKTNFSSKEIDKLTDLVQQHYKVISGKFSDTISLQRKQAAWDTITKKICSIAPCIRTREEVKKKWEDLKQKAKKKGYEEMKKRQVTGNVPFSDDGENSGDGLNDTEEKIIGLLGVDLVCGLEGGGISKPSSKATRPPREELAVVDDNDGDDDDDDNDVIRSPTPPASFMFPSKSNFRGKMQQSFDWPRSPTPPRPYCPKRAKMKVVQSVRSSKAEAATVSAVEPKATTTTPTSELLEIEKKRLVIEKKRLKVDRKRLKLEKKRSSMTERAVKLLEILVSQGKQEQEDKPPTPTRQRNQTRDSFGVFEKLKFKLNLPKKD
ncbi:myb-related transcription factor, partner of profilin-like [Lineus longissimus]|uniref:myb-related transcription factor, partner of profilin-like n=1 Tax=Lineus longissimus TaxID=88925 RepID=UPI00315D243E